jgi:hypothetical protein
MRFNRRIRQGGTTLKLHELTRLWWERILDEDRVNEWLLRLHQAETQGGDRFEQLAVRWDLQGEAAVIVSIIASDEYVHGEFVANALRVRGVEPPTAWAPAPERYWDAIYRGVSDRGTACAAAAIGEMLALNRFRVLIAHPRTPEDVRALARLILPDEERHARQLRALAGKRGMDRVRPFHRAGMAALGLTDVEDDDD